MRSKALDTARGVAIVGVVFNHAVDGLVSAELLAATDPIAELNSALYVFRMPALVFLVGLFVPGGIVKRGVRGYLRSRTALLVYLYLVWQVVQGVVELATSAVRNGATRPVDILTIWLPLAHLWFLPFLALATVVVTIWAALPAGPLRLGGGLLLFVVTVGAWAAPIDIAGLRGIGLIGFLAAGAALGLRRALPVLSAPRWMWALAGLGAIAAFSALHLLRPYPATLAPERGPDLAGNLISLVAACAGVVGLLAVSVLVSAVPGVGRLFSHLGQSTLPIYLGHIVVVAGLRIALSALGVEAPMVLLIVLIPCGVAVPYLLSRIAPRIGLGWLFALPGPLARRMDGARRRTDTDRGASPQVEAARQTSAPRLAE